MAHECEGGECANSGAKLYVVAYQDNVLARVWYCDECADYARLEPGTQVFALDRTTHGWDGGSLGRPDYGALVDKHNEELVTFHASCFNDDGSFKKSILAELASIIILGMENPD